MMLTKREVAALRTACRERILHLQALIGKACGSLYPALWAIEAAELEALFERITGETLMLPAEAKG